MTLRIKKLDPEARVPSYAHQDDAGMDFYSNESLIIPPGERRLISTGIAMAIPSGFVGLIWDKSGISNKNGIKTLGGVIDSNYRGEIKIGLHNLSQENFIIEKRSKIAQMLIQPVVQKKLIEVDELDNTDRGQSGFGSTGLK